MKSWRFWPLRSANAVRALRARLPAVARGQSSRHPNAPPRWTRFSGGWRYRKHRAAFVRSACPGLGDIGRAGVGQGAGAAGQKVSDYLIRRAEQYQPVIQLQAGTPVTVVFLEGAWLDGRKETNND